MITLIPTISEPDTPNRNGVIYTKSEWHKAIANSRDIRQNGGFKLVRNVDSIKLNDKCYGIPFDETIGDVIVLGDDYIIAEIYNVDTCGKIADMVNCKKIKAYMKYLAKVGYNTNDKYSYANDIRILYFALGPAIPGLTCDELNSLS